jgi:hypothetical protein
MRFRAVLAGGKPALLPHSGTTGWTSDSEYLFWGEFCFHAEGQYPKPVPGVGTLAHKDFTTMIPGSVWALADVGYCRRGEVPNSKPLNL